MQTAGSYRERVGPALDRVADRLVALVTAAPDPTARVPSSPDWSVRDVAAHLVLVTRRHADGPEGRGTWTRTPADLPRLNHDQLEALEGAGVDQLCTMLRWDLAALRAQIDGYGGAPPSYRFHGGERVAADVALGILLGELVVHGWDVAHALRRPWPVEAGDVALIVEGVSPILPGWVRPDRVRGLNASFEIRLRGQSTHVWSFRDGRLRVDPPGPVPVDVHISADPAALLLVLYGRQSQWRHIPTGRLLAWGRRPWLALTLASRFHNP